MADIKAIIDNNKDRYLNELIDLLKIPSISADKDYKEDVIKTAEAVQKALDQAGVQKTASA